MQRLQDRPMVEVLQELQENQTIQKGQRTQPLPGLSGGDMRYGRNPDGSIYPIWENEDCWKKAKEEAVQLGQEAMKIIATYPGLFLDYGEKLQRKGKDD